MWFRWAPQLRELDLRFNPVQNHKAHSVTVSALSSLVKLDGVPVQQQDPNTPSCLTLAALLDTPSLWHSSTGEASPSGRSLTAPCRTMNAIHTCRH
jgi:hypothetical protein